MANAAPIHSPPARDKASAPASFQAALLLGGVWTVANRLSGKGGPVWLARLAALPWLGTLAGALVWWGAYLFGDKGNLDVPELNALTVWVLVFGAASIALSLPLARRAQSLLAAVDAVRQRRQARLGVVLHAAIVVVAVLTNTANNTLADNVRNAKVADEARWRSLYGSPAPDPYAPTAGKPVEVDPTFPREMKYCTSCGAERKSETRFCAECGAAFGDPATDLEGAQTHSEARPSAVPTRPPRQLRCVECSSPIDAGLVCARCASTTAKAVASTPVPNARPLTGAKPLTAPTDDLRGQPRSASSPSTTTVAQAGEASTSSTASFWSFAATAAFVAFCFTTSHISPFALVLAAMGLAIAVVAALVAAAIWGRPTAQAWFSGVLFVVFSVLFGLRVLAKPSLGVSYDNVDGFAQVSNVEPDGPLGRLGLSAPLWIQSVDGTETGFGKSDLRDVIASKRALDRVRIVVFDGRNPSPATFDATLFDR